MNTLFGVSMDSIMQVMLAVFLVVTAIVAALAVRNRLLFKIGLRNLPRRRAQTTLIIFGLMLSTVIMTSAFGTGDTLSYTIRSLSVNSLGAIDETVTSNVNASDIRASRPFGAGVSGYFSQSVVTTLRSGLDAHTAAGVEGIAQESVPLIDLTSRQTKNVATVTGVPVDYPAAFGPLTAIDGTRVTLGQLGPSEMYLGKSMADKLNAHTGDRIEIYAGNTPVAATVRNVLKDENLAAYTDLLLPLDRMQRLAGVAGQVNQVLISNTGDALSGAARTDTVTTRLRTLLANDARIAAAKSLLSSSAGQAALRQQLADSQVQKNTALTKQLRDLQRLVLLPGESPELKSLLSDPAIADQLRSIQPPTLSFAVNDALRSTSNYAVHTVKQDSLQLADTAGSIFTTGFVTFGLFSIASGIALIFLIFVMLAAERRSEMGMARAIGTKRRHLIQQFLFEGYVYDLTAALVGVVLGVGVCLALTAVISSIVSSFGISVQCHVEPRSLIVAFCLGALVTFATVAGSAWRVSRINIVSAIRDLPEDLHLASGIGSAFKRPLTDLANVGRRLRRGRVLAALLALLAAPWHLITAFRVFISRGPLLLVLCPLLVSAGISSKQLWPFSIGISLGLIGAAMMLRWILRMLGMPDRLRNRIGFSLAGILLVVFWLIPFDALRSDLNFDIEMFFISGLFLILGGIWTVMYNIDLILAVVLRVFGGLSRLTPMIRMAVSYPLQQRFRTGMTMFMFSLVLFSLVVQLVLSSSFSGQGLNLNRSLGGYNAWGTVSPANPIHNIQGQIAANPDLRTRVSAVGGVSQRRVDISTVTHKGTAEGTNYRASIVDDSYLSTTHRPLHLRATGYATDSQVWRALRTTPGLAVVSSSLVAAGTGSNSLINNFTLADKRFAPTAITVHDQGTNTQIRLTVIGVLDDQHVSDLGTGGELYISRHSLTAAGIALSAPDFYLFRAAPGQDVHQMALALGSAFLRNGLDVTEAQVQYDKGRQTQIGFDNLLAGFMALGLVVGIAALGVIAFRSVVERRQQIGMMRALGFQRGMIRTSFLMESSFVAILGSLVGAALGLLLAWNLVAYFTKSDPGLQLVIPWAELVLIIVGAYLASLLTTYLPAWQASRVYPAEALRYE